MISGAPHDVGDGDLLVVRQHRATLADSRSTRRGCFHFDVREVGLFYSDQWPAVGAYVMGQLLDGGAAEPRFSLATKGTHQKRAVY